MLTVDTRRVELRVDSVANGMLLRTAGPTAWLFAGFDTVLAVSIEGDRYVLNALNGTLAIDVSSAE